MTKLEELEEQISTLSMPELKQLQARLDDLLNKAWDRQFEEDAQSGKLDSLAREAREEYDAGQATEL